MEQIRVPLRYNISSWNQLPGCLSNNSTQLHLRVSTLLHDRRLNGTIIKVEHEDFGTLFACLVDGGGPLLSERHMNGIRELSTPAILAELEKYGFLVTYQPQKHLDGDQLQYLLTLNQLGFQKIRLLNVHRYSNGVQEFTPTVVAFNIKPNSSWLNNWYSASEKEFLEAINNGSAINISAMSKDKKFKWDWLTYVADIEDILKDNAQRR